MASLETRVPVYFQDGENLIPFLEMINFQNSYEVLIYMSQIIQNPKGFPISQFYAKLKEYGYNNEVFGKFEKEKLTLQEFVKWPSSVAANYLLGSLVAFIEEYQMMEIPSDIQIATNYYLSFQKQKVKKI